MDQMMFKPTCGREVCEAYLQVVDELKQAQKLTRKLDTVLDSSYDGIYITDGNAITQRVNKAYERITGIKPETILGKSITVLVDKGIISQACTMLVLEKKEVTTIQQKLASGKIILVTGTPIFDENGEIEMVVNNVRDITELLELREALKEKERAVDLYNSELERLRKRIIHKSEDLSRNVAMKKLMESALRAARHDTTILISGETGVGKEVLASYIHKNSDRKKKKLVKVNCSAIPENLIESELFGYEKGAFTGANINGKIGLFEEADEGTLFLDEIGELPVNLQSKLLRVLQEQEIQRVGGVETIKIDVRIIAATNRDLQAMADQGLFRKDLYYRLNIIPMHIPALRERKEDLIPLINDFLDKLNTMHGEDKKISKDAYACLERYDWPGNIREVKNVIERIFVMTESEWIREQDLPNELMQYTSQPICDVCAGEKSILLKDAVARLEYDMITKSFEKHGNVRAAAMSIGIDASTFVRKRMKYEAQLASK